jgi:hypothetical protein
MKYFGGSIKKDHIRNINNREELQTLNANTKECSLLRCDAMQLLLSSDVSEECIISITRVKRISELRTTSAITSN